MTYVRISEYSGRCTVTAEAHFFVNLISSLHPLLAVRARKTVFLRKTECPIYSHPQQHLRVNEILLLASNLPNAHICSQALILALKYQKFTYQAPSRLYTHNQR